MQCGPLVRYMVAWEKHELVEVERIPGWVVKDLLDAEINGRKFINPYSIPSATSQMPAKYKAMEQSIAEILEQAKYWTEKKKELSDGIMKAMVESGAYPGKEMRYPSHGRRTPSARSLTRKVLRGIIPNYTINI